MNGHDNWVLSGKKNPTWVCRDCRNKAHRDYMHHLKASNPKKYTDDQTAKSRRWRERHPEKYKEQKRRAVQGIQQKRAQERAEQDPGERPRADQERGERTG